MVVPHTPTARRRGRAALAWGVVALLAAQGAYFGARDYRYPEVADPEYGRKLAALRARLRERPDRPPLVVLLGSSRVAMGVRPDQLWTDRPPERRPAVVFNCGICGAGPVFEHM